MKKRVMALVFLSCLLIGLIVVNAETISTRVYGNVDPLTDIRLTLSYTANSIPQNGQVITKQSNNIGDWDYKIGVDEGTAIDLKVNYKDIEKDFSVQAGQEFEIQMFEDSVNEAQNTTQVVNETTSTGTASAEATATETANKTEEKNETEKENKGITGKSIFDAGENKILDIIFLALGLFVIVFLANIASSFFLNFLSKTRKEKSQGTPIKIIKLSEKLEKVKQRVEEARKAVGNCITLEAALLRI